MSTIVKGNHLFQKEHTAEEKGVFQASSIAMAILLISLGMLFATLFMGYAIFRGTSLVWPPMGMEKVPLLFPSLSTFCILLSSWTFLQFKKFVEQENLLQMRRWILFTLILGFSFFLSQIFLWYNLNHSGVYVHSGIFASIIYGFTWIHAGHMVLGIVGLFFLLPMAFRYRQEKKLKYQVWVTNIGKFWHFLDVIWLVMFITIFVF